MRGPDQPPKPTRDPDPRSRPIQTSRSRPIQTSRSRPMIQTPFVLRWLDIFFFKVLKSITLYYRVLLQYYFVLQSIALYHKVRCWVISWILEKFGHPVPDLVPDRSRPVPWNPRAVSIHSHVAQEEKTGLCVQCRIIWFSLSRIYEMIIMIPGTPFQTCGKDILRKWSFQTSGSSRNPFIKPFIGDYRVISYKFIEN